MIYETVRLSVDRKSKFKIKLENVEKFTNFHTKFIEQCI